MNGNSSVCAANDRASERCRLSVACELASEIQYIPGTKWLWAKGGGWLEPQKPQNPTNSPKVHHAGYSAMASTGKRASYTAGFKLKFVETAEKCGNSAAGREHSDSERLGSN